VTRRLRRAHPPSVDWAEGRRSARNYDGRRVRAATTALVCARAFPGRQRSWRCRCASPQKKSAAVSFRPAGYPAGPGPAGYLAGSEIRDIPQAPDLRDIPQAPRYAISRRSEAVSNTSSSMELVQLKWKDMEVRWRRKDGYLDASFIGGQFNKRPNDYVRLDRTDEYLSELSNELGLPGSGEANALVVAKRGGNTWFHPRVSIDYARWLSPTFAVWMDKQFIDSRLVTTTDARPSRSYRQQFCILNETDLHIRMVAYVRRFHPDAILVAGLGELQDTEEKRLGAWAKGYLRGQPDLLVLNRHKKWAGLAVELKHPGFEVETAPAQTQVLDDLSRRGWLTLVSNDYDVVCRSLDSYMREQAHVCHCCQRLFSSEKAAEAHRGRKRAREAPAVPLLYRRPIHESGHCCSRPSTEPTELQTSAN
jgi:hypothetical protein